MTLWAVSDEKLTPLPKHRLDSEDRSETWIAQDPSLLGMDVLIIGRQVTTSFGKRIDLLATDDKGKDFEFFNDAVTKKLQSVKWSDAVATGDDGVDEKEDG